MGVLTTSGSLARVLSPIVLAWVYKLFGLYITMGLTVIVLSVGLFLVIITYKRFSPRVQTVEDDEDDKEIQSEQTVEEE